MRDGVLLAIDAGTGSCRAVLFALDGTQIAIGQREYRHREVLQAPGSRVFDTRANWQLICACVREALISAEIAGDAVLAVCPTSMRQGMVLYDSRGRELWACSNVDSRADDEASELMRSGIAQEIYDESGSWVSLTAPARFLWLARHQPDVFAAIARVGMLGDWIVSRLSGEFVTDPSLGSSSGMFALAERDWSDRAIDICGLDRAVFPRVVDAGTVVGTIGREAATDTELRVGTPVVVGGADTQMALVALGAIEPGRFAVVGGSFWQQAIVLSEPEIDPKTRLRTTCHAVADRWLMEGIGFYSGIAMRWFLSTFCDPDHGGPKRAGVDWYDALEKDAALLPPGSGGVVGIFSNLMREGESVHAPPGFLGFDIGDATYDGRIQCFRAIEESAAYVTRGNLRLVEEITAVDVSAAVLTGGAAKGTLWPQILANTLGMPVRVPAVKESTAQGAALYAGVGAGMYADVPEAAAAMARFERTFDPDPAAVAAYDEQYARWLEVYRRCLALTHGDLMKPLWRAPGAAALAHRDAGLN